MWKAYGIGPLVGANRGPGKRSSLVDQENIFASAEEPDGSHWCITGTQAVKTIYRQNETEEEF